MTEAEEITRGRQAQELMAHPLIVEAFDKIEQGLIESIAEMPLTAKELEREAVRSLQLLRKVKRELKTVIETGKMAELGVQERESFGTRLRKAFG